MLALALIPASFFVWLVTDHFRAASVLQWHPGWAQDSPDLAAPFFRMGGTANFGSATTFGSLLQKTWRSEEHTSELQSLTNLVCRLLLEKKKKNIKQLNTI